MAAIDPDVTSRIPRMGQSPIQPLPQGAYRYFKIIPEIGQGVQHGQQARRAHDQGLRQFQAIFLTRVHT